jgi:hypothetical protein
MCYLCFEPEPESGRDAVEGIVRALVVVALDPFVCKFSDFFE